MSPSTYTQGWLSPVLSCRALEGCRGPEEAPYLGVPLYSSSLSPAPLQQVQARHRPSSPSYGLILQPHSLLSSARFHEGTQTLTALHVWETGAQNSLLGENWDRGHQAPWSGAPLPFLS